MAGNGKHEGPDRTAKLAALWARWREEFHAEIGEMAELYIEECEAELSEKLATVKTYDLAGVLGSVKTFREVFPHSGDHLRRLDALIAAYEVELVRRLEAEGKL